MYILENVPLSAYSTMRLGGVARYVTDINTRSDLTEALAWAEQHQLPVIMIGGGSNIFWKDEGFPGLVMINKIQGFEITGEGMTEQYITAGAGMIWDDLVAQTVERNLSGVEFLSLVPGTVGATPIQNVGAYGQEVKNTIVTIEAYNITARQFVTLRNEDCGFGYRTSRFKTTDRGRFFITSVTFFLTQSNPQPPYYAAIEEYCKAKNISPITPQAGREAVIAIRRAKLPDPALVANNGSFFANPVVDGAQYLQLQSLYPDITHWMVDDSHIKLSAAWLIDQAGFKDFHDPTTGIATWAAQPLVLVNENAKSTQDLLAFKQKIIDAVQTKFGVILQQEPELLP